MGETGQKEEEVKKQKKKNLKRGISFMESTKKEEGNVKQQDLIETKELPVILTEDTQDLKAMVEQAEAQVQFITKIKKISLNATNSADWIAQDGRPYLQLIGSMKIRQLWGVEISEQRILREEFEDEAGKYILYTCSGKAKWRNHEIEDIGTCSTRDDFFGKQGGVLKDIETVDLENVKKKCVTNFQNRILKKILGLSFTWEDLEQAGIKRADIQAVNHGRTVTEDDKKRQDELKGILKEVYPGRPQDALAWLIKSTEFKGSDGNLVRGIETVEKLTAKRLEICLHKAHELKRDFDKSVAGTNANGGAKKS